MISLLLLACSSPEAAGDYGSHGPIAPDITAALGAPLPSATDEQRATFARGLAVAKRTFTLAEGLGPGFNVAACANCHERPTPGGAAGLYRNFALGGQVTDDGAYLPIRSAGESGGVVRLYYYGEEERARPAIDPNLSVLTQRNPIPFYGVGLLAALSEEEILSRADPEDADGDGISGRPNYDRGFVGRFGVKAQTVSIEAFIRGPLRNQMGITSDPLSNDQRARLPVDSSTPQTGALLFPWVPRAWGQAAAPDGPLTDTDAAPDPELRASDLFDLVSFTMLTAAPPVRPLETAAEREGQAHFDDAGCGSCHTPRLDGPAGPLPVYSDLLLHDMGDALADGVRQGEALGSEFRTQPLWGVAAEGPYLHDGRASTLDAAIRWHGGEAAAAARAYAALSPSAQAALLTFLRTLGGAAQASPGLHPPGAPLPAPGDWGGPMEGLSADDARAFAQGFYAFDRDHTYAEGVGAPRFNGDSCRACHFQPVIGGAGPRDVNVTRYGVWAEDGFALPTTDTVLHRETALLNHTPLPQADANLFEMRQTPPLFGLGLIEAIPDSALRALADPEDLDGDGISGVLAIVDGDRVGRFGWKAQVPSLAEFVRDALGTELGLTLPDAPGLVFGRRYDDDDTPDPELSLADAAPLLDYLRLLGPPPRDPALAQAPARLLHGEATFKAIGCDGCHVPSLPSPRGPVPLYSDLLLHEILPPGAPGVEEGAALATELRTPPLWGIAASAPYLHDGRADTLEAAIRGHDGEGAAARDRFLRLPPDDALALLRFLEQL